MGLETIHLRALLLAYPEVHQGYLGKQGPLNLSQFVAALQGAEEKRARGKGME